MTILKAKVMTFIMCLFITSIAFAQKIDVDIDAIKKAMEKSYRPFNSELVFLDVNNEVFVATDNGHYLFRPKTGTIYDLWYKTRIETPLDLQDVPNIHVKKLSMNVDTLNVFTLNPESKSPVVHVFLDPLGPSNRLLFEQVEKLESKFQFKFIILPGVDPASAEAAKKLACQDNIGTALSSLLTQDFSKLKSTNNSACQEKILMQTSVFASVLKIRNMPTIISSDGDVNVGFQGNLSGVLLGKDND